jgi:hypothetical protein
MGPHVTERLSAYMDGELAEGERTEVDSHLRACPACAGYLEDLRGVEAAARALPLDVPDGYFEAFPGRVRQRLAAGRRRRAILVPAWIGAAAAAVVLALITPRLLREPRAIPAVPGAARDAAAPALAIPAEPAARPPAPDFAKDSGMARKTDSALRRSETPNLRANAPAEPPAAVPAAPPKLAEGIRPQPTTPPTAGGALAREKKEADERRDMDYAAAPPADRLEPAPQSHTEAEDAPAREEQKTRQDKTARAVGGATQERAANAAGPDARFQLLARSKVSTVAEARALRDAWRAFVRDEPRGPRADEARVRAIEAGAEAWRKGRDEKDRAEAERDGREYLARADALQTDRVRSALKTLSP